MAHFIPSASTRPNVNCNSTKGTPVSHGPDRIDVEHIRTSNATTILGRPSASHQSGGNASQFVKDEPSLPIPAQRAFSRGPGQKLARSNILHPSTIRLRLCDALPLSKKSNEFWFVPGSK